MQILFLWNKKNTRNLEDTGGLRRFFNTMHQRMLAGLSDGAYDSKRKYMSDLGFITAFRARYGIFL